MSDDKKQVFRRSLEDRHTDPNRVWSFKFPSHQRAQEARKWLQDVELEFYEQHQRHVPLWEIIAAIAEELEYGKPSVLMSDKKMLHVVLKRLSNMESVLKDIAERDPVIYQQASSAHQERTGETIDDDFIGSMFDDFDNTGHR